MTDKIISMMPQLLCKQLASDLGKFLDNEPGASPAEMLGQCDRIMNEIGAVKDENGEWSLPEEDATS
jgi:hypothetical protein